jgi:hypothetical protein
MEELKPEELEELVQELAEESEEEEALSPEVDRLLRGLGRWSPEHTQRDAAEQLGRVGTSSPQIVQALIAACQSPSGQVRAAAAKSLRAPAHQEYLRQHPEVVAAAESALQQAPDTDWLKGTLSGQGRGAPEQRASLIRCLGVSAVAGLAVGLLIALWDADQLLFHDGGLTCGAGFIVALVAGAVVGAVVGAAVQGREDLNRGLVTGAASAGIVAAVSWFPITFFRILQLGGP